MTKEPDMAGSLKEICDLLISLVETTEAGFARVGSEIGSVQAGLGRLDARVGSVESEIDSVHAVLGRLDARVARIENWNLDRRFGALEQRIVRLEQA